MPNLVIDGVPAGGAHAAEVYRLRDDDLYLVGTSEVAVLWFGVQLSDGRTATTLDHPVIPLSPPTQPYLASIGGPGLPNLR